MNITHLASYIKNHALVNPTSIAIRSDQTILSYKELEGQSNHIANFFDEKFFQSSNNIGETVSVCLLLNRSVEIIISIIGLLKAGLIFVPVSPDIPEKRIQLILEETKTQWVITSSEYLHKFRELFARNKWINILTIKDFEDQNDKLQFEMRYNKYCYIYFTSGSTGIPKGVLGRHKSLHHFIGWEIMEFGIDSTFCVSQFTPPTFDPYLRDIFVPLMVGGTICIPDYNTLTNSRKLIDWIDENKIGLIHIVPSLFKLISHELSSSNHFLNLKCILLAGELLRGNDIRKFIQIFNDRIQLVNVYGPTETTLAKFFYKVQIHDAEKPIIPVGMPIKGAEVFILDEYKQKCLTGNIGEIYIRTPYISSGYFNDKELNKKVFIKNPFSDDKNDIIYKTGDIGRILFDGNIELSGRLDGQVKIRGNRVETGEIENFLLHVNYIKEAVVVDKEDKSGEKYLCAFLVLENKNDQKKLLDVKHLKRMLAEHLPSHMIPSYFIPLDIIPLTSSGKIDRKALPESEAVNFQAQTYTPPRSEMEKNLVEICSEVLSLPKTSISLEDNFFELGGHSLKAIVMLSKIHEQLNVQIPLTEIFKNPTIRGLAEYISVKEEENYELILPVEEKEYYALSSAQKRLYFLQQMDTLNTAYNIPVFIRLPEDIHVEKLENVFKKLIMYHDNLRTSFHIVNGSPVQRIHKDVVFRIEIIDFTESPKGIYDPKILPEAAGSTFIQKDGSHLVNANSFIRPFDLSQAPLMRVGLLKTRENRSHLLVDLPHIITDGVSQWVLRRDFVSLYTGELLPTLRIQYRDFVEWQNNNKKKDKLKQQEVYWLKEFEGEIPILNIPTDFPRPVLQSFEGNTIDFEIKGEINRSIMEYVQEKGITLYMLLLAVTNILFSKLSCQEDIVIGSPVAGRTHADLEKIIGMFVNTLPLRNYPIGEKTFPEFLQEIKKRTLNAFENQEYQFEDLISKVPVSRHMGRNPLFDIIFVLQNMDRSVKDVFDNRTTDTPVPCPQEYRDNINGVSKLDLTITAFEIERGLKISFQYCTKLFKIETVQQFMTYFNQILLNILEGSQNKIKEIDVISSEDKSRILHNFNENSAHYPKDKTINLLFEEQAEMIPEHIAIVYSSLQLTYQELNDRAGRLAQHLKEKGVEHDTIVGINMKRSAEMVLGIIGILKAGGGYLPIDPEFPKKRRDFMLKDSAAQILVTTSTLDETDKDLRSSENSGSIGIVFLDLFNFSKFTPSFNPIYSSNSSFKPSLHPSGLVYLAYIIYTSGTTGMPKGVIVEHRNVIRLLINDKFQFDFGNYDVWTMFHSFNFDFSVWEMFGSLLYGGKLIIVPKMVSRDPGEFLRLLKREHVTVLNQTPSAFYKLLEEEIRFIEKELCIRYLIFGGEALKPLKLMKWREKYPEITLTNMFGITETTVHVTFKEIKDNEINNNISNIGFPIPTMNTYIGDKYLNLAPLGIAGELLIGGGGVTRGYLNQPELTAAKFIPDLFNENELIYRSGDLGRYLQNGELEYLGRIDHQVQLKGFRIELGEIENQLLRYNGINDAVVIVLGDENGEDSYLCAYIVSGEDINVTNVNTIREYLGRKLPDYMIPRYFTRLEKIPLTSNGKIDLAKLPAPSFNVGEESLYTAPVNKTQKTLLEIWKQVLHVETMGIKDNYFHLGGDSIKAIALVSGINNALQSDLKIADLYMNQTIEELALLMKDNSYQHKDRLAKHLLKLEDINSRVNKIVDSPENIEDVFPMSDIEIGMIFHHLKDVQLGVYNNQNWYQVIVENFNIERLKKAMDLMMEKHPILRTAYIEEEFAHVVYKTISVDIPFHDLSGMDKHNQEAFITQYMVENRNKPFDVQVAPLWRMSVFNLGIRNALILLWEVHHTITDGWSNALLLPELYRTYCELENNPRFVPQKLKNGYKEYILQQMEEKQDPEIINYWKNELSDYKRLIFPQSIEVKIKKGTNRSTEIKNIRLDFGVQRRKKLEEIARKFNTSLKHLCFAANALMLNMFSYENDIVVGLVTNNRPLCEDGDKIVGCFLNTVPVRIKVPEHVRWVDFIRAVDRKMLELKKYDRLPLLEIVTLLEEKTSERNQLMDTLFNFIDFYAYEQILNQENTGSNTENKDSSENNESNNLLDFVRTAKNNFPFSLSMHTTRGLFQASIGYSTALLDEEILKRMCDYYERILDHFIVNPEEFINKNNIISPSEKENLVYAFNNTWVEFPGDKTIHQLFVEQALWTPDRVAIVGGEKAEEKKKRRRREDEGEAKKRRSEEAKNEEKPFGRVNAFGGLHLSYRELNERADKLAGVLIEKGVLPDMIVGIMMERSIEMIIGLLGILKSGGAYLPIDPSYPQERINYMLKDSGAKILINKSEIRNPKLRVQTNSNGPKVNVQNKNFEDLMFLDFGNLDFEFVSNFVLRASNFSSSNLAYIIYTSGTTGQPKGSLIEHRNVVRLLFNDSFQFDFSSRDVWTLFHSFCFDFSVWEMYGALLYGGKLVIVPKMIAMDTVEFITLLKRVTATVLNQTPSAFYNLINEYLNHARQEKNLYLRYVIFGGEALSPSKLKEWREKFPRTRLINMFGITETTVHVTYKEITNAEIELRISNIGKPIPTLSVYILDKYLRPVPMGVTGEICVGGKGVCRGYLNRVDLTTEKFIENPYYSGGRLYRSGDTGRFLENGDMEYLGRIDHQVKIRGFRIELGEIESQLLNIEGIKDAVVIAKVNEDGDKFLCAYIVLSRELDLSEIREYVSRELPDYMIPSYFVNLEKIPLNPHGKVDREALPDPLEFSMEDNAPYIPPRDMIEKLIVEVWEKVLGKKNISINDNFFLLGGDSIKSIQIISRMNSAGFKLEMKDLFKYPVISALAPYVKKIKRISDQVPVMGVIPLTPIQKWFFEKHHIDIHHFNQSVMFYSRNGLNEEAINSIFAKIQKHHDVLRMTYKEENGKMIQINNGLDYPFSLEIHDLRNQGNSAAVLEAKATKIQASIDLEKGPLMKLGLFRLDDGDRLLVAIHHLVIDAVSWRILFEDIETLYQQYKKGESPTLPLKTDSFKVWAEKLSGYANSETFLKEKAYWAELESTKLPFIEKDFDEPDNYRKDSTLLSFVLDEQATDNLLTKVNDTFGTDINDILLTVLALGIKKTWKHNHALILLEGHGREEIIPDVDISRTIGWFTSAYPLVIDISYENDLGHQIKEVKEAIRRVPNKGIGYGILKYITNENHKKDIRFQLNPQFGFNYLGQFDAEIGQMSFEIAKESAGNGTTREGERDLDFDISGMIANNRLGITVTYNKKHYKTETINVLVNHIQNELRNIISFCCLKENTEQTPSDFTYKMLSIGTIDRLMNEYKDVEDIYTLTPMQEGMLFHTLIDQRSYSYFEQISYRLHGDLDISLVEKSLNELLKRHDILRTSFVYKDIERPVQIVLKNKIVDFYYENISKTDKGEKKENFVREFKAKDKKRGFDLAKESLMRVSIIEVDSLEYEFIWSFHHILMDGWCVGILNIEFFEIYNSYLENRPYQLPILKPYRTYIQWLEKQDKDELASYWKSYLDSFEEPTIVPKTNLNKNDKSYKNESFPLLLSRRKTTLLNKLAGENRVTLNIVIQTIWGIMLGKYNGKEDVVFGAVVSGRPSELEGVESMVGLFINTIPVRICFREKMKFYEMLQNIQEEAIAGERYHYYPLAEIQSRTLLKQNLIDHIFIFENYPIAEQIEGYGSGNNNNKTSLKIVNIEVFEQTNYDLNVILSGSDQFGIRFQYNGNVYEEDFVERIAKHFIIVVDQVIENQELEVRELTLLSEDEKNQLLYEFNDTAADYPKDTIITQLFEEQVEKTPDRIALVGTAEVEANQRRGEEEKNEDDLFGRINAFDGLHLSYWKLNEQSGRLAGVLIEKGVLPDAIAGIMVERSVEMVVGIMGILKSSGAYLPIDREYPEERIDYILKDSGAKLLVTTNDKEGEKVRTWEGEKVFLEEIFKSPKISSYPLNFLPSYLLKPSNLAYVIYTSGSTGKPKGVMVEHHSVVNYIKWAEAFYLQRESFNFALYSSLSFDLTVTSIYVPLISGNRIVVYQNDEKEFVISKILRDDRVQVIKLTPTHLKMIMDMFPGDVKKIKKLIVGGEDLAVELACNIHQLFKGNIEIYNEYGPTEATVGCMIHKFAPSVDSRQSVPIGVPIANTKIYILDNYQRPAAAGVIGELYVSGEGLARGYLNNPELTAEKFNQDLWDKKDDQDKCSVLQAAFHHSSSSIQYSKLYRTGDLARWLPDGNIEFLGRIDHQVKIRGFRIEPGEIERQLLYHDEIKSLAVISLVDKGENYLCAYFTSDKKIEITALRNNLAKKLPNYMIPSYFNQIDNMPLTASGKIDRKTLVLMDHRLDIGKDFVEPQNEMEKKIAQIWKELLGLDKVGMHDNFFEIGGNSLKVITLNSKLSTTLQMDIPIAILYQYVSIEAFVKYLTRINNTSSEDNMIADRASKIIEVRESRERRKGRRRISSND